MKRTTVKSCMGVAALLAATVLSVAVGIGRLPLSPLAVTVAGKKTPAVVLLDAGHGGMDGGAMAPDGTKEKDLNLDIARRTRDFLRFFGYTVRMTREDDRSLHTETATTTRQQKVSDMHQRLALYEQADLVLSIHQNKFGQANCRGIQLFYSPNHPLSQPMAASLRETVYALIQPDNTRELKRGDKNIFLLYKTTAPAVLVECGFLSNPTELAQLKTETYRQELAYALACGVLRCAP